MIEIGKSKALARDVTAMCRAIRKARRDGEVKAEHDIWTAYLNPDDNCWAVYEDSIRVCVLYHAPSGTLSGTWGLPLQEKEI